MQIGCLFLYTSAESMLDQLIDRPLEEGDLLSNANTVIYMGKVPTALNFGEHSTSPSTAAAPPATRFTPTKSTTPA